jgi:uncharacterized protein with FMN-binding domain
MALSGAVILAAYAVGYARTEGAAQRAAAPPPSAVSALGAGQAQGGQASGTAAQASGAAGSSSQATSSPAAGGASSAAGGGSASSTAGPTKYKNGTFTAQGWGVHGPVTVAVVIHSGRIVSANITQCGTTFPCNYLSALEAQVVTNQGPPTDYISGATASSLAYYQAVTQALTQA